MKRFGTAVLLAGGQSSRMGFDKQTLCVGDMRLTDLIFRQLTEVFEDIVVVTGRPELYAGRPVRVVSDRLYGVGPLAGIHAGLQASESEYIYLMACDMPSFSAAFARYMMGRLKNEKACVSRFGEWIEPFHGFYHRSLISEIEGFVESGRRNIFKFLEQFEVCYIEEATTRSFSSDWSLFDNLNTPEQLERLSEQYFPKDGVHLKKTTPMLRFEDGHWEAYQDEVVSEYTLHLHVNGTSWAKLLCSPVALKELVYGFLYSERLIDHPNDLTELGMDVKNGEAFAKIAGFDEVKGTRTIATSGARLYQGQPSISRIEPEALASGSIAPDFVLNTMRAFTTSSEVFMTTGGVHACSLASSTQRLSFFDDIGRHNALDKVIGRALLDGVSLKDKLIFFSGRISSEIIGKCANAGISTVVSRSAPTFGAIEAAKGYDMTVVGFTRGNRFNVYNGHHRLMGAPAMPEENL
ncbi:formate dehydrogenase accessory sulfurtransferase FdhD [Acidaminobacter hydrogenoformans]|uniref:Multifunctional fusion protein n=1 Tax=Acidaminobacter hydrogenoformans DSM 2784 TaxID=1120920 RepID=A0A1G5RUX6_9FIRM|nr:formate dehydrogenase accessory sulfurtransferase FdhD [Acidaminobacter hydrogenoformans]SCZ77139.1 formate dehydrogenase family accessory protein FdhD [Acidaminobacter hydrogenoformans DSM 2784]